jgi:hypothetical protein
MQNVLVDDRRIWVDLYVYSLFSPRSCSSDPFRLVHNRWHVLTKAGPTIPSRKAEEDVVMRVAVALAVVMILKPHAGTGMVPVIGTHRMAWYSTSKLTPKTIATAMKGDLGDAPGQGHLVNDVARGGEAVAGTRTGG